MFKIKNKNIYFICGSSSFPDSSLFSKKVLYSTELLLQKFWDLLTDRREL